MSYLAVLLIFDAFGGIVASARTFVYRSILKDRNPPVTGRKVVIRAALRSVVDGADITWRSAHPAPTGRHGYRIQSIALFPTQRSGRLY